MNKRVILAIILLFAFYVFASNSYAILVESGDNLRVDFDLSEESLAGPYEGVYAAFSFDSSNYFSPEDGYSISVFDDNGSALEDGIGYLIIHDVFGSFDLIDASVAGRFYDAGIVTDTTGYVLSSISVLSSLPDLSSAIASSYPVTDLPGEASWVGIDIVFPESPKPVPEPSTFLLLVTCLIGLVGMKKKFKA